MGKITPEHYALAYTLGREVYHERLSYKEALDQLVAIGMNQASASFSIGNLRQMLNGAPYHRGMSMGQTRHFLVSIEHDYAVPGLEKAINAFAGHLPYFRKSTGSPQPGLSALLKKFTDRFALRSVEADAVNDLVEKPEGISAPDRAVTHGTRFKRDPGVRAHVVMRAKGFCEFCGKEGFAMGDGRKYMETHHIIGLARQGPDTLGNVIGLCPEHHREAHFGVKAAVLEKLFLAKLAKLVKGS